MSLEKLARYWRTLRYLRPVQFYGRAWFRLRTPRPDLRAAPALRISCATWKPCARRISMHGPTTFQFIGVERVLADATDWNRADWPKLWLYNAHYFDDLTAANAVVRGDWHRSLIERWIVENPPGQGNGWEPYPSSLRIVNWVKWALSGNVPGVAATQSLAIQTRFLRKRLEFHLLGNHLWANAKALLFAGAFFDGDEAAAWRTKGLALLHRELTEQILPDGGHFERSPMYHALVLEDVLDMVQLADVYAGLFAGANVAMWRDTAARMLRWLRVMSHPDGGVAFFNDSALGIASDVKELADYARILDVDVLDEPLSDIEVLGDSGYIRLQTECAVVIADVAEIGPDYLPGHAHADTLSFELSLYGRRVLVNGGTSTYETNAERMQQRGTAMHNTVQVDGVDSSEVWGSFRVARRARPLDVAWGRKGASLWIEAAHDGYRRLRGAVTHRRRWTLDDSGLSIADALTGRFDSAVAAFRFAPGLDPSSNGDVAMPDGLGLHWCSQGGANVSVTASTWHPRFGVSEPCALVLVPFDLHDLQTTFAWRSRV